MAVIGNVAASRYHELVASSLRQVEVQSGAQWSLGDAALEIEPMREWGCHPRVPEDGQSVEEGADPAVIAAIRPVIEHMAEAHNSHACQ